MTFAEAIAKLMGLDGGEELAAAVQAEITKKNNEAKNLRDKAKEADKQLKEAKTQRKELLETIGVDEETAASEDFDLDNALEAYTNKLLEGKGKAKDSPEFIELQKQVKNLNKSIDKLTTENTEFKSAAETEKGKRHGSLKENALIKSLEDAKAVKPGFLAKSLLSQVRIDEVDGKDVLVYVGDDGEELSVKDGIAAFLTANPELVANSQNGGGGTNGSGGSAKTDAERGTNVAAERNKSQTSSIQPGLNPWGGTPSSEQQ
jgi:hypothetical protein